MAYSKRHRSRPPRDPESGITYARQKREVPEYYLFGPGEEKPHGSFDLDEWAEMNDSTCNSRSGGLANPTSMAVAGGVSRPTFVNSVVPQMLKSGCLHREGPVMITATNTAVAACREYRVEQREKQRQAGKRNAHNLIRWESKTDPTSGSNLVK